MEELPCEKKQEILDLFGKILIDFVRDHSLLMAMKIANGQTINKIKLKQYSALLDLKNEQKEAVCDLISETITDTIYSFLEMFEQYDEFMKLIVIKDGVEYNMKNVSEKMGGEIVSPLEDGWIQKFSTLGRYVL